MGLLPWWKVFPKLQKLFCDTSWQHDCDVIYGWFHSLSLLLLLLCHNEENESTNWHTPSIWDISDLRVEGGGCEWVMKYYILFFDTSNSSRSAKACRLACDRCIGVPSFSNTLLHDPRANTLPDSYVIFKVMVGSSKLFGTELFIFAISSLVFCALRLLPAFKCIFSNFLSEKEKYCFKATKRKTLST